MNKEWWDVDPTDWKAMWQKTIGLDDEDPEETQRNEDVIFEDIPPGRAVLEIGSGVGRLLKVASKYFHTVRGVEISSPLVKMSKEYLGDAPQCRVVLTDGYTFPFSDNVFDFIFSLVVFHHMPTLEIVQSNIREAYRVLRPGGLCRIQTIPRINDGWHFTAEEFWNEFEQVGFVKEKIEVGRSHPSHLWVTARKS